MIQAKRNRPATNETVSPEIENTASLTQGNPKRSEHRALIDDVHILVLETRTGDVIRTRRTTYFALQTAQAALDRATARGHVASLILCKLVPVDGGA